MLPALLAFYSGAGTDHAGRALAEIQGWSHERLEEVHDFIQWLFPLPEPSPVNPRAPVLDAATVSAFTQQDALRRSLETMLAFYGLRLTPGPRVERADNFARRATVWLSSHNHNHLRITRILRCCALLGLGPEARAFLDALETVAAEHPGRVTATTLAYWRNAVR